MKKIILAVALTLGFTGAAMAADGPLSYDYAQLTGVHTHEGTPTNGLDGKLSFDLTDGLFAQGDVQHQMLHGDHSDRYQAGLGYHVSFSDTVSGYALASGVVVDSTAQGAVAKYGYDGEVGLRWAVAPTLELSGAVEHQNLNLDAGVRHFAQNYGKVGVSYFVAKDLALTADFRGSKVEHQVGAGLRYTW